MGKAESHSGLSVCVNTIAIDYEMSHDPQYEDPALSKGIAEEMAGIE